MAHLFLVKDIAFQAGLSTATVDRVLNGRPGVRRQTEMRVKAAIAELEKQQAGAMGSGRVLAIDIVMETPQRFSDAVRTAFEAEMAAFLPGVFRCRFHFAEVMKPAELVQLLDRIRLRGTHGIVLKAPDVAEVAAAVARADVAGIPVVTLVTDLPNSARIAYAGADNRAAGETAAYLIGEFLGDHGGKVLVTLSSGRFRGEEEREIGFRRSIRAHYPDIGITEISEGHGTDAATGTLAAAALAADPAINAVYSIGGGNRAVLSAFDAAQRPVRVFVAHDLDADNRALLAARRIGFVLHHDLRTDARSAFRAIMSRAQASGRAVSPSLSTVEIITPYNMPAGD
ncbi:LacI family DNA-binding transcriptional regulator [Rhizobium anhuiense]|uniref:LacI family DNA-binding transcriptional regulator n=1 Tax=Rhizobium anhuiense TaxID=1184720 RepID=A0A3S0XK51_9HYPH|nr:LacI family DNA-binding transcriptional regulator [Rhizobium anhuiense]RUM00845.1 LacI family DNA-binding transcriptional regulator [Rhizobium anhuiense]UTS90853.1 LacI family DNA-binding transcriptional regulator [Rhizobium anhuiense bv. trifolii]GGD84340.1 transcriptional regulator [Rhizobium anhuiense]